MCERRSGGVAAPRVYIEGAEERHNPIKRGFSEMDPAGPICGLSRDRNAARRLGGSRQRAHAGAFRTTTEATNRRNRGGRGGGLALLRAESESWLCGSSSGGDSDEL